MAKHGVADSPAESISESATSTAVPSDVESESVNPTDENTTTPSSSASSPKVNGSTKKNLDISSYDAFPILGGGKASTASAVSWGPNATVKPVATPKAPARTAAKPTQKSIVTESFTLKLEQRNARAKTIPSEVLSRAQSNNSVSIDCSTSKSTRASHFIIKGKLENVHKARRELLRELSIRVTEVFQVPASVRALIIGPKGSDLRPITERSGTQIQITRKKTHPFSRLMTMKMRLLSMSRLKVILKVCSLPRRTFWLLLLLESEPPTSRSKASLPRSTHPWLKARKLASLRPRKTLKSISLTFSTSTPTS